MPEIREHKDSEKKATKFWAKRALGAMSIMRQSKETGLLPRSEGWSNVIEHELVEAEAADVLGEKLGLSDEERRNLRTAALLHDIFKRKEIETARVEGPDSFTRTAKEEAEWIRSAGYPEEVIKLVESVVLTSFKDFTANFESISVVRKIIHYVDDITLRSDIVSLDERIKYIEEMPDYKALIEWSVPVFGKKFTDVQREISRRIEEEFAPRLGVSDPSAIPDFVKGCINERIAQEGKT